MSLCHTITRWSEAQRDTTRPFLETAPRGCLIVQRADVETGWMTSNYFLPIHWALPLAHLERAMPAVVLSWMAIVSSSSSLMKWAAM